MKSRTQIWAELFRSLASGRNPVLMRVTTRNGAEFDFRLPAGEAIGEETFDPEYEFPFRYGDIVSIDLYDRTNPKTYMVTHDFEEINKSIDRVVGVDRQQILRILVPKDLSDS